MISEFIFLPENKGKFTLVVASFFGKSQVAPKKFQQFENMFNDKSKVSLDDAADEESWNTASTLRSTRLRIYARSIRTAGNRS